MHKHFFFYRNEQYALKRGAVGWQIGKEFNFFIWYLSQCLYFIVENFWWRREFRFQLGFWGILICLEKNLSKQSLLSKKQDVVCKHLRLWTSGTFSPLSPQPHATSPAFPYSTPPHPAPQWLHYPCNTGLLVALSVQQKPVQESIGWSPRS